MAKIRTGGFDHAAKKKVLDAMDKVAPRKPAPGHQETPYSCGAASLCYALKAIGVDADEDMLRDLSETTKDGADEQQLGTALEEIGVDYDEDKDSDFRSLLDTVGDGSPCLLCVDDWEHWVAIVGVIGDRVVMRDPANTPENIEANTVHILDEKELTERWRGPDDKLYVLVISG